MTPENSRVPVSLSKQRAYLLLGGARRGERRLCRSGIPANATATVLSAMAMAWTAATPVVAQTLEAKASTPGMPREMWQVWVPL
jgi:hypothetical protein